MLVPLGTGDRHADRDRTGFGSDLLLLNASCASRLASDGWPDQDRVAGGL
jgi:hypothetical protein